MFLKFVLHQSNSHFQYKLRRTRLPVVANFLLTSDVIPTEEDAPIVPSENPLTSVPRSHPPPLYYLPVILTPAQEAFINIRKTEVRDLISQFAGF